MLKRNLRTQIFWISAACYLLISLSSCSSIKELAHNGKSRSKKRLTRTTVVKKKRDSQVEKQTASIEKVDKRRDNLVNYASKFLYRPYRYGGQDPSGFDCSGFTSFIYTNYGFNVPRTSKEQAKKGRIIQVNQVEPGDLMFFGRDNKVSHVAMVYSKEGNNVKIIHATSSSGVIITHYTDSDYWLERFLFAKDIVSSQKADFAFR